MSSVEELFSAFRNPSKEYTNCPYWICNGDMRHEEIEFQLEYLCDKGMHILICDEYN